MTLQFDPSDPPISEGKKELLIGREIKPGLRVPAVEGVGDPVRNAVKRTVDILLALAMLVAFAPLMSLIALMVWREDGAPIFFGHRRIGKNGKPFRCLKFRTMVRDSDAVLERALSFDSNLRREWEESYKLDCDPRILDGVGHLLRRTSLDELPQLFNVLRGDMSLVGPRPIIDDELEKYGGYKTHYLSVKPGLTGPWQVGGRSDTSYEERVTLDVWYVENASIGRDLSILLRTMSAFVSGQLGGGK